MTKGRILILAFIILLLFATSMPAAYSSHTSKSSVQVGPRSIAPISMRIRQLSPNSIFYRSKIATSVSTQSTAVTLLDMSAQVLVPHTSTRFIQRLDAQSQIPLTVSLDKAARQSNMNEATFQISNVHRETTPIRSNAICTVTTTADSGIGSLRQCLINAMPGDTINFDPNLFPSAAPNAIFILTPLPFITENNLTIDATNAGVILFAFGSSGSGLVIDGADGVTIRGLIIANFPEDGIQLRNGASNNVIGGTTPVARNVLSANGFAGLYITGNGTNGNQVLGNYIGTDETGSTGLPNGLAGIEIDHSASNNIIGGTTTGARNVLSGNAGVGVWIHDTSTNNNQILGNYIGISATGQTSLSNAVGVGIGYEAQNNIIGGTTPGARNVISGNSASGIQIQDSNTTGNLVQGNYIGSGVTGMNTIGNLVGVTIGFGAQNNIIGGDSASERNIISGNQIGLQFQNSGTTGNLVKGNYVGPDVTGLSVIGNQYGITFLVGARANIIGGTSANSRNIISGNTFGVQFQDTGTTDNIVHGNYIGPDITGLNVLGNWVGVIAGIGAQNNIIGGDLNGAGNVISGNEIGIEIENSGTNGTQILGNYIGVDASGTAPLSNRLFGVHLIDGVRGTLIGGSTANTRNIISGNMEVGIFIQDTGTMNNQVLGNYIGTNVSGTIAISNTFGVLIGYGAQNNIIGGTAAGEGNLIGGNRYGLQFQNEGTTGNQVLGNTIGLDATGVVGLGNYTGISILDTAQNNVVGGISTGTRNTISSNEFGIAILGGTTGSTNGNQVRGNYIGTNTTGISSLGNEFGIVIDGDAHFNVIGGTKAGAGNLISGNKTLGIQIQNDGASDNQVLGNRIGTDVTGMQRLGNLVGVTISFGAQNNVVGGESAAARNLISGNLDTGIIIQGWATSNTTGNQIMGNYIGTDVTGLDVLSNSVGIVLNDNVQNNFVGGQGMGEGNVISGNNIAGVKIESDQATNNRIWGNYVGTSATGLAPIGNGMGILIRGGAQNNFVGGDSPETRNVISGNTIAGVVLEDGETSGNMLLGNYIGTDVTGMAAVGNDKGVIIWLGATDNTIGGAMPDTRNIISGNNGPGIEIQGDGASNQIVGNYIGTTVMGMDPLGNDMGILLAFGAQSNIIGGNTALARNIISGNMRAGIAIQDVTTTDNQVAGNYIGLDATGTVVVSNTLGVVIEAGAHDNLVGGENSGTGNVISGQIVGIWLRDNLTSGNKVQGNNIGTDAAGQASLANNIGILIDAQANNNTIGGQVNGNLISGNVQGIVIRDLGTNSNKILGNTIGGQGGGNKMAGIYLSNGVQDNIIGISNTITYNGTSGIIITGTLTLENTITRNAIYQNNGLPINYLEVPDPIPPHSLCYNPVSQTLSGTVCSNCLVEVFANPDSTLAGTLFLVEGSASSSGTLTLSVMPPSQLAELTVTMTNVDGTTSEFYSVPTSCTKSTLYLPLAIG